MLMKLVWLWGWFLAKSYAEYLSTKWYYWGAMFILIGILVMPSFLYSIYFVATFHHKLKGYECFQALRVGTSCLLVSIIFISVPLLSLGLFFVPKGI